MTKFIPWMICVMLLFSGAILAQDQQELTEEQKARIEKMNKMANEKLALGEKCIENKDIKNAFSNLNSAVQLGTNDATIVEKANAHLETLRKMADEKLAEAKAAEATDIRKAMKLYHDMRRWSDKEFTPKYQEAYNAFNTAENRAKIDLANKEEKAEVEYTRVDASLKQNNNVSALTSLIGIIARYPGTKTAEKAQGKYNELMANKEVAEKFDAIYRDEVAKQILNLATTCLRYNEKDQAIKYLKIVSEEYKDTRRASFAEQKLKELESK